MSAMALWIHPREVEPGKVMCRCCGEFVNAGADLVTEEHDRADLIAMIVRGDFDG
jgi:hypothetical protein